MLAIKTFARVGVCFNLAISRMAGRFSQIQSCLDQEEVLCHILSYLDTADLWCYALVSRKWRHAASKLL